MSYMKYTYIHIPLTMLFERSPVLYAHVSGIYDTWHKLLSAVHEYPIMGEFRFGQLKYLGTPNMEYK